MASSQVFNISNLDYLREIPDKFFDLVVDDPPYGLGDRLSDGGGKLKNTPMAKLYRESSGWDVLPSKQYFEQVFRVSKNQIFCGANYFMEYLPSSRGIICWDKKQFMPTLSSWEFLWTSFDKTAKTFTGSSTDLNRFHPTQKPVSLYDWLYKTYLPNGGKVFDGHLGSGSNRIAAYKAGNIDFYACEIDKGYFEESDRRFNNFVSVHSPASENPITFEGQHKLF